MLVWNFIIIFIMSEFGKSSHLMSFWPSNPLRVTHCP